MFVDACLDDIVTIVEKKEKGWVKKIDDIFQGQDFSESAQKLNMSAAKVMVISEDENIIDMPSFSIQSLIFFCVTFRSII